MAHSIYVSAINPSSATTGVTLGLVAALSAGTGTLGFFRPVHQGQRPAEDPVVRDVRATSDLPESRCSGGVSASRARQLLAAGNHAELDSIVLEAYEELARECDVVVVDGAGALVPGSAAAQVHLDIHTCANLGCVMAAVLDASQACDARDALTSARITRAELLRTDCTLRAVVLTGMSSEDGEQAPARTDDEVPLYILPQHVTGPNAPATAPENRSPGSLAGDTAWVSTTEGADLVQRLCVGHPAPRTPLRFLHELVTSARRERKHIVLPEGEDPRILRAAEVIRRRDFCDLTVLGNPEELAVRARAENVDLDLDAPGLTVIDHRRDSEQRERYAQEYMRVRAHKNVTREQALERMSDGSYFGTMMVQLGDVDGMVSGAAHTTANTIRPALEFVKTREGVQIVSSVFLMLLADRVLVYGDCAVNPAPDEQQLADIALASAQTARQFHVDPRIAMLSYSTGDSGAGPEVDRVRAATELARAAEPALPIEGPIQYDAAVDPSIARSKLPDSPVAGRATVFVFPDLNAGNNAYKAVQQSAGAVAVGPVLQGLRKPVNDLSRGCTVDDIVNTVAITAIQAQDA